MDPPYNQHPYASNYFMLNVILNNKIDGKMSKVSGILDNLNRSAYNKRQEVKDAIDNLVKSFGFTNEQATAIVDLRLCRLTNNDIKIFEKIVEIT